ncbi:MAG: Lrp/AsnC ligand binding domain-containing protein [Candidatus Hadarchaeia archaeon]
MTEALILIEIEAKGVVERVMNELGEMEEVESVAFITGPYDIMAIVTGDIHKIITKIREIEGVKDTTTNIIIAEHIKKGLEKKI